MAGVRLGGCSRTKAEGQKVQSEKPVLSSSLEGLGIRVGMTKQQE